MTYDEFLTRYLTAVDRVEADWATLTSEQRRRHSRSERINRIKARHFQLHANGLVPIAFVSDDYHGEIVPLARHERGIVAQADRLRQPSAVKPRGIRTMYDVHRLRESLAQGG